MLLEGRDILSAGDLSSEDIEQVFEIADRMKSIVAKSTKAALLQILATLFYEPSMPCGGWAVPF